MRKIALPALVLLATDRLLKMAALKQALSNSWFTLSLNKGIVFSFSGLESLALGLAVLIMLACIYSLIRTWKQNKLLAWPLTLMITGAASNIWDRLLHGAVIDYINISWLISFNLADIYISIGVLLLIYNIYKMPAGIDKENILG